MTQILVTGVAGFIGMACAQQLLSRGDEIIGVDNISDYYDVQLKIDRLSLLQSFPNFSFHKVDCSNMQSLEAVFRKFNPKLVLHLAAQPGVRYSLENPHAYIESNINGFLNVLECCKDGAVEHLVYASSSSVYGWREKGPFKESAKVDEPVSLYAASKKANELMAHAYSHIYNIRLTGLRFFTVYGPWGRPDMAPFIFANSMLRGEKINIFNAGNMVRDFTYIDDIVKGVICVLDKPFETATVQQLVTVERGSYSPPHNIFNIGNGQPTQLLDFVKQLE